MGSLRPQSLPPDVVFFDVGGTLLEVSPSVGHVYATACGARGAAVVPASVQRAFDAAWVALSEQVPRGADRYRIYPGGETEWWERVSSHAFDLCGVPAESRPPVEELRGVFAQAEAWRVYSEVAEALEVLKGRGCRLGVISNWDSRLPALLGSLGLDGYFESLIYSAGAGSEKPHPAIFAAALERFEVGPSRAAHVGDRLEEDYAGAKAAGLRALLLSRGPRDPGLPERMRPWGDPEDLVSDLREAALRLIGGAGRSEPTFL